MTKTEAAQILAILKAAYPNSYRNMTVDEANGTATVWSIHFSKIPVKVVYIAINKWISKNQFPPSIGEIRGQISGLYWEVWHILDENKNYNTLSAEQVREYEEIFEVASSIRRGSFGELPISELSENSKLLFIGDGGVKNDE